MRGLPPLLQRQPAPANRGSSPLPSNARIFFSSLLGLPCLVLSSRTEQPDFFFRASVWRVGPRSAFCAPRALRRGGGISPPLIPQLPLLPPNDVLEGHPSFAHLECGGLPPLLQPQPAPANRSSSPAHHRTLATSSLHSWVCFFLRTENCQLRTTLVACAN